MRNEVTVYRLCLLVLTSALVQTQGADYYVSTQGNDSSPGTSTQPFRTITRAYRLAAPGVTIRVLPGVYTDYTSGWGIHLGASGTASSPIVLKSQVKGGAVIDGQNASDRNEGIYIDGSYNIVDGFEIKNAPNGGISIWGSFNQILNNEIHHNGTPASTSTNGKDGVFSGDGTRNNIYTANYIHDNGRQGSNLDHGLYLCGDNEVAINNILVRNAATGLQIAGYTTVSNIKIYNNVIAFNGTSGVILWLALSGVDIKNNIIYQNGSFGINSYDAHGSGVVIDHNLMFGNGSGDYNFVNGGSDYSYTKGTTVSAAPLFLNSSSAGFDSHLGSSSPAINAALNLYSTFTTDKDGAARVSSGAWDIGAYRYGAATDTIAPAVSMTSPANNATVSGSSVSVSANATDSAGVVGVQFKLDGANLGAEDMASPSSVMLNTMTVANGSHTLSAVARDAAGNQSSASAISVVVSNPTALPTITLTSPVKGASYTTPATINFAASVVSNGHTITTVQFYNGTTLLGQDATAPYSFTWSNVAAGTYSLSARVVYDAGTTVSSSLASVSVTSTPPPSSGLTFASTSGTITAPFVAVNGTIYQASYSSVTAGGRAAYSFAITNAGNYAVSALVNAPDVGANSLFVNIDSEPTDPLMIWDIPLTSGSTSRTVSWRGNGTPDSNQFIGKAFYLSAGTHQLIVRGREANCPLGAITLTRVSP